MTENVIQTVPVSHKEVRLEREPITGANRGAAMSGSDISEEEHEVTLHAERPVVSKDTVQVERVRLGTRPAQPDPGTQARPAPIPEEYPLDIGIGALVLIVIIVLAVLFTRRH